MVRKKGRQIETLAPTVELQPLLKAQRKRKIRCSVDEVVSIVGEIEEEDRVIRDLSSGVKRLDDSAGSIPVSLREMFLSSQVIRKFGNLETQEFTLYSA